MIQLTLFQAPRTEEGRLAHQFFGPEHIGLQRFRLLISKHQELNTNLGPSPQ